MRTLATLAIIFPLIAACSDQGTGQGFEVYEVTPSGAVGPTRTDLEMQGLPAVARIVVAAAPTADAAAEVQPYSSAPSSSVAAVTTEATWLRVVEDASNAWLVAEAASGRAPDAARLRAEAVQRSGCLVIGVPMSVGSSTVFQLDCS